MDDLVKKLRSQIGDDVQQVYSHEALFRLAADRIAALVAANAQLREALADAVGALDAAGAELSEFANILSREPREANLTYQSARDAQNALARAALEAGQ